MEIGFDWLSLVNLAWSYLVSVLVHELGHYFVARAKGITRGTICIGGRPQILKVKLGKLRFILGARLFFAIAYMEFEENELDDKNSLLYVAAGGPLASFLLLLACGIPLFRYFRSIDPNHFSYPHNGFACLGLWGLLILIFSLLPISYGGSQGSDGTIIWRGIRNKNRRND